MKPTEQLRQDHDAIKIMLTIMEKICSTLEAGETVPAEHLKKIVEFIRVFADKCHHGKEEDVLFPAMEKAGVPREGGPIGVMLMEHDIGRNYVRHFAEAVEKYPEEGKSAAGEIVENARNYAALLNQHIDKENNILFPIAEMHLSDEQMDKIEKAFEKMEKEKIGHGKHEELHAILKELKAKYLNSQ